GPAFLPAAPVLVWMGLGLIPAMMNSSIEVYLYASGDEAYAVRFTWVRALVQLAAGLPLIMAQGAVGAAIAMALAEAVVWLPLRRRSRVVGEQRTENKEQRTKN